METNLKIYLLFIYVLFLFSCHDEKEHTAPAIYPRDSVSVMTSYGVNTLISDSGVIKYKIVTERWEVNQNRNPSRWIFDKGLFLEQFDDKYNVESFIQCDTAYYFDVKKLWELRGRVRILTKDGIRFSSEELFWDQNTHELYSHKFSKLITPERQLQGTYFKSDEHMSHYIVSNSKGLFEPNTMFNNNDNINSDTSKNQQIKRQPALPQKRHTK